MDVTRGDGDVDDDDDNELLDRRFNNKVVKGAGGYVKSRFYVKIGQGGDGRGNMKGGITDPRTIGQRGPGKKFLGRAAHVDGIQTRVERVSYPC
jgi:hypothetical protein